ncbi:hypothetical protein Nepgr_007703 [Nepenthes gracilis]|uniref:Uncharacterized protein n=1 Tax=Nepenthes gracilis TaxID=150966 RepID=A0AAD3XIJ3_NEPGR|nr:hypothetical protein Nepgr_007703 [Nepenthes gracilis]
MGNSPDHSQTPSHLQEPVLPLDSEVSTNDELMHEKKFAVASICPIVQPTVVHVPSLSNQESPSTTDARNHLDQPQALLHVQKQVFPMESKVSKNDILKHANLPSVGSTSPFIEPIPICIPFFCNQEAPSITEKRNCPEHSHGLSDVQGQVLLSQSEIVDNNQLEHEQLPTTATLYPFVQCTLMPGSPLLQPEELDPEAQLASSSSIELGIATHWVIETDGVPSSSNQETLSTGERRNYPNHPQALPSECNLLNNDQLKHEKLLTAAPSYPVVEPTLIPGSSVFRLEGLDPQAWVSSPSSSSSPNPSSTQGKSPAVPTVAPMPPPTLCLQWVPPTANWNITSALALNLAMVALSRFITLDIQ